MVVLYYVNIKSGDSGHYSSDNCDILVAKIPSDNIPRIGEILHIYDDGSSKKYLVREIVRSINLATERYGFGEWTYVYVVEI